MSGRIYGLPWINRNNYILLRRQLLDADRMPRRYEEWLINAEKREAAIVKQGKTVLRVFLDDGKFIEHCQDLRVPINTESADAFAARAAGLAQGRMGGYREPTKP